MPMPSLTDSFIGHSRDHLHTLLITYLRRYGSTYMPVDRTTWCRDTIMTGQSLTSLRSKKTNITDFSLLITVEDLLSRAKCFLVLPIVVRKMTQHSWTYRRNLPKCIPPMLSTIGFRKNSPRLYVRLHINWLNDINVRWLCWPFSFMGMFERAL